MTRLLAGVAEWWAAQKSSGIKPEPSSSPPVSPDQAKPHLAPATTAAQPTNGARTSALLDSDDDSVQHATDLLSDGALEACLQTLENFSLHDEMYSIAIRTLARHATVAAQVHEAVASEDTSIAQLLRHLNARNLSAAKLKQATETVMDGLLAQEAAKVASKVPNIAAACSFLRAFVAAVSPNVRNSMPSDFVNRIACLGRKTELPNETPNAGTTHQTVTRMQPRSNTQAPEVVASRTVGRQAQLDLAGEATSARSARSPDAVAVGAAASAPRTETAIGSRNERSVVARSVSSREFFQSHVNGHMQKLSVGGLQRSMNDDEVRHATDCLWSELTEGERGEWSTLQDQPSQTSHGESAHFPVGVLIQQQRIIPRLTAMVRQRAQAMSPTFIDFVANSKPKAKRMYTVNAPNVQFVNTNRDELQKACAVAFGGAAAGFHVTRWNDRVWVVKFSNTQAAREAEDKAVFLRGIPLTADFIHSHAPKIFIWDASIVSVSVDEVYRRVIEAFEHRGQQVEVLRQDTRTEDNFSKLYAGQQFIVRFTTASGLFSFFIPVVTSCSASPRVAWFRPWDYSKNCLLCKEPHSSGTVCAHAKVIGPPGSSHGDSQGISEPVEV